MVKEMFGNVRSSNSSTFRQNKNRLKSLN